MALSTIRVTWMDGPEQVYPDVTVSVRDGVLHVHQYSRDSGAITDEWHFPISNIRQWKPLKAAELQLPSPNDPATRCLETSSNTTAGPAAG